MLSLLSEVSLKKIIEKKAYCLIGLKSNQGSLFEQVSDWLRSRKPSLPSFIEIDKDHGRGEIRSTYVCEDLDFLEDKPEQYAKLVRDHWSIENNLHWHLDVTFREDKCTVWKNNGPANLSVVRKLALFLLTKEESKISLKRKRKKAARSNLFLKKIKKNT